LIKDVFGEYQQLIPSSLSLELMMMARFNATLLLAYYQPIQQHQHQQQPDETNSPNQNDTITSTTKKKKNGTTKVGGFVFDSLDDDFDENYQYTLQFIIQKK
jgi:hypothetical protein